MGRMTSLSAQSDETSTEHVYMVPYIFSIVMTALLLVVFRIFQVVYRSESKVGRNKLTLLPLGVECAYLVILLANSIFQYYGEEHESAQEI